MSYEDKQKATKLALVGSIREDILPNSDLVDYLLNFLNEKYPLSLQERFGIENITNRKEILELIADRRKLLRSNNQLDLEKAEMLLLKEFKDGLLGNITLEWL